MCFQGEQALFLKVLALGEMQGRGAISPMLSKISVAVVQQGMPLF